LLDKPRLVAANKMDEAVATKFLRKFRRLNKVKVQPISCLSEEGIPQLKEKLFRQVRALRATP
jgi:GTP-binding protein